MTANERSDMALEVSARAQDDADTARIHAAQFDPGFRQPGIEIQRQSRNRVLHNHAYANHVSFESTTSAFQHPHSRGVTPVAQQHYVEPSQQYLASQRVQPHQHAQFYQPQPTPNRIAEPHHQLDTAPGPSHAYDSAAMENAAMAQQYNVAGQYGYQQPMEAHAQVCTVAALTKVTVLQLRIAMELSFAVKPNEWPCRATGQVLPNIRCIARLLEVLTKLRKAAP